MRKSIGLGFLVAGMLAICLIASGCKREGCTNIDSTNYDPEARVDDGSCIMPPPSLRIHFTHVVGNRPFSTETVYQDSSGRSFQLQTARFYISNAALLTSTGSVALDRYQHVSATAPDIYYTFGSVAPGNYTGLRFDVGVDSVTNHSDPTLFPADHPLSPTATIPHDHWTWNVGYVFLKVEGVADTSASLNGSLTRYFDMHVATDPLLTEVRIDKAISIGDDPTFVLEMKVDWLKALSGYNFQRSTHTTDNMPVAQRAMNNFVTGITIQ